MVALRRASDTLTAQIIAVDQPPKIQVIHWTLPQNGLFSVALDSVYKGSGVWAVDPDNIPSSLRWSAVVDRSSKDVGQVSIQSNRLTLVPAVNSLDPILLDLAVRDSAGLKYSTQIWVRLYKRPPQLYAFSLQQFHPTGARGGAFPSQYPTEPLAL